MNAVNEPKSKVLHKLRVKLFKYKKYKGSLFSTSSTAFIVCRFSDDGHSGWCEVISQCRIFFFFSL